MYPSDRVQKTSSNLKNLYVKELVVKSLSSILGTFFIATHCKITKWSNKAIEKNHHGSDL